jgi:hypothetical protein
LTTEELAFILKVTFNIYVWRRERMSSIGAVVATSPTFLQCVEQELLGEVVAKPRVSMRDLYGMSPLDQDAPEVPPVTSSGYKVSKLWEIHKETLRLLVLGKTVEDVASELDLDPVSVQNLRKSPLGKAYIAKLTMKADEVVMQTAERISRLAPKALTILRDIMSDGDQSSSLRVKVAMDMLDRAGLAAVKKVDSRIVSAHLSAEDIEELKGRARSAGVLHTVKVEPVVEEVLEEVCV